MTRDGIRCVLARFRIAQAYDDDDQAGRDRALAAARREHGRGLPVPDALEAVAHDVRWGRRP